MTDVGWLDVLALALGLAVCIVLACLVSQLAAQSDPDMVWPGWLWWWPRSLAPHCQRLRWRERRCASSVGTLQVPICI